MDKLTLGAIIGFLRFIRIIQFRFRGYRSNPVWLVGWDIVKAFPGSIKLFWCLSIACQHIIADKVSFGGGRLLRPSQAV